MSSRRGESVHLDFTVGYYETVTVTVVDAESGTPDVEMTETAAVYVPDARPNIVTTAVAFDPAATVTALVNVPCCPPEFDRTATKTALIDVACALTIVELIATGIAVERLT